MLKRKFYSKLIEWKSRKHKCLLISGQRQVGKTSVVREFAKNEYEFFAELNFSTMNEAAKAFSGNLDVDSVVKHLSVLFPEMILEAGRTLLFFDEIQECDGAYSSLKQFTEDGRFDVIASWSFLDVSLLNSNKHREKPCRLIPLGYVEYQTMYGLDFEEYLWAKNVPVCIIEGVKASIKESKSINQIVLKKLNGLFREFMMVGGMPEAVSRFVEEKSFTGVKSVLNRLHTEALHNFNMYNTGINIAITAECFDSIPDQLSESDKEFMYSRVNDDQGRQTADKYTESLLWIRNTGYGNFCYRLKALTLPLKVKRNVFKVYLSDTGMLVNRYGDKCLKAIYSGDLKYNLGSIVENAVAEALMKSGYVPRYFSEQKGDKRMELDFVIETMKGAVAIEVKSGKDRSAPSINKAIKYYLLGERILLSEENIHYDENGVLHMPLFASSFLKEMDSEWDIPISDYDARMRSFP